MADTSKYTWTINSGEQVGKSVGVGGLVASITIDTSILDAMTTEMQSKANDLTYKYGVKIAGEAAMNAPVDTSTLRNSILAESGMEGNNFIIQDGVEYGIYQELGTSRIAARPFLTPAVEANREDYLNAVKDLLK